MAAGQWVVRAIAWIYADRHWSVGRTTSLFEGAIELYLIFSFAWLVQQVIGLLFHALMGLKKCSRTASHGEGKVMPLQADAA